MERTNESVRNTFSRKTWWIIFAIGLVGLVFLLRDHTSHIFSILPFLILLACPMMHLFMHKGHGSESGRDRKEPEVHNH